MALPAPATLPWILRPNSLVRQQQTFVDAFVSCDSVASADAISSEKYVQIASAKVMFHDTDRLRGVAKVARMLVDVEASPNRPAQQFVSQFKIDARKSYSNAAFKQMYTRGWFVAWPAELIPSDADHASSDESSSSSNSSCRGSINSDDNHNDNHHHHHDDEGGGGEAYNNNPTIILAMTHVPSPDNPVVAVPTKGWLGLLHQPEDASQKHPLVCLVSNSVTYIVYVLLLRTPTSPPPNASIPASPLKVNIRASFPAGRVDVSASVPTGPTSTRLTTSDDSVETVTSSDHELPTPPAAAAAPPVAGFGDILDRSMRPSHSSEYDDDASTWKHSVPTLDDWNIEIGDDDSHAIREINSCIEDDYGVDTETDLSRRAMMYALRNDALSEWYCSQNDPGISTHDLPCRPSPRDLT